MVSQNNIKTVSDYSPLSREEVNFFSSQIQSNLNSSGKLEPIGIRHYGISTMDTTKYRKS